MSETRPKIPLFGLVLCYSREIGEVRKMAETKKRYYLKNQVLFIVLVCWMIPVMLVLSLMAWHVNQKLGKEAHRQLQEDLRQNLEMCTISIDGAVEASRLASYDGTIGDAWNDYRRGHNFQALYRDTRRFLALQYSTDNRFRYSVFGFTEDPNRMRVVVPTGVSGVVYPEVIRTLNADFPEIRKFAENLDTAVGFWKNGSRVYLVRNVVDRDFETIGILALALNEDYYFEELFAPDWAKDVEIDFNNNATVHLRGDAEEIIKDDKNVLSAVVKGDGYTLSGRAVIDFDLLLRELDFYKYFLMVMILLLVPMHLFVIAFMNRQVNNPVYTLVNASTEIEKGNIGYQIDQTFDSREFQYLAESFNRMSTRLKSQIIRIYEEEIALRDAHIKALQSHINPHFLNNTLEIINWEARMNGDVKVSKMIESLSTVLDAALDRRRSPKIRLAEEMTYVNAYLHIVRERFGKRLKIDINLPEELMEYYVPRLILQPVIENAVEHGIGAGGNGLITLSGRTEESFLLLDVENSGGMTEEDEEKIRRLLSPGHDLAGENSGNIGIANVNTRLKIMYGETSGLSIFRKEENQVIARLKIAIQKQN